MDCNSLLWQKRTSSEHWLKKLFSQERKILYFSEVSAFFFSGCCGSLLLHKGFALVAESRGCSVCWRRSPPFSRCRAQALKRSGFRSCSTQLGSCDTWAYLLCSMWNLPGSGIEPMSPALVGGFLSTVPPGKSDEWSIMLRFYLMVVDWSSVGL